MGQIMFSCACTNSYKEKVKKDSNMIQEKISNKNLYDQTFEKDKI